MELVLDRERAGSESRELDRASSIRSSFTKNESRLTAEEKTVSDHSYGCQPRRRPFIRLSFVTHSLNSSPYSSSTSSSLSLTLALLYGTTTNIYFIECMKELRFTTYVDYETIATRSHLYARIHTYIRACIHDINATFRIFRSPPSFSLSLSPPLVTSEWKYVKNR